MLLVWNAGVRVVGGSSSSTRGGLTGVGVGVQVRVWGGGDHGRLEVSGTQQRVSGPAHACREVAQAKEARLSLLLLPHAAAAADRTWQEPMATVRRRPRQAGSRAGHAA